MIIHKDNVFAKDSFCGCGAYKYFRVERGFVLLTLCEGAFMKIIIRLFALVAMVSFIGCATSGSSSSSGSSSGALTDADYKRMGITKGGPGHAY